jgi:sugar lactone lactonase YvrE
MWMEPNTLSARNRRRLLPLSPVLLVLMMMCMLLSTLSGGVAAAEMVPPVPVVGVDAFGIGYGQLGSPDGIAVDSKGDLFVADAPNYRVLEYAPRSSTSYAKVGTVVAGEGGKGSGLNQLDLPGSVALDAGGDLFVSDSGNNRVMEYAYDASSNSYASTGRAVAGTGTAGSGLTQLNDPGGIAIDAKGDLFVADTENDRVEEFAYSSATGSYASTATQVAGTGVAGTGLNQFDLPASVALDATGNLFVADWANARVLEFSYNPTTGTYSASGKEIGGTIPSQAGALAFDANGDLFVAYGYLGYGGVLEIPYNSGSGTFANSGSAIDPSAMVGPDGIAFDSHGDLFVAETSQTSDPSQTVWDMVLEFTYTPATATFSPLGTVMGQLGRTNTGISAIGLDSRGDLFVSDGVSTTGGLAGILEFPYNTSAQTYSLTGSVITSSAANALALDSGNDLFAAESTGVLEFPYNSASGGLSPSGVAVPGATELASLTGIAAIAVDGKNDLFVATDTSSSGSSIQGQVLEFAYNSSSGTWAAAGTLLLTVNYSGAAILVSGISGIALDANGDLFVSDGGAGQVQEYLHNAATGSYAKAGVTVAGVGGVGSGLDQLDEPTTLATDGTGDLFVYDAGNGGRIMEFTGNPATGVYAASGTAIFTGSVDNWPETGGIAVDSHGDLFFGNNLVSAEVYEASVSANEPTVSGVTPANSPVTGSTIVTVTGSGFSTTAGATSVSFGTVPSPSVTCASTTSCSVLVPAATGTGTVDVTATVGGLTSATSVADQFSYYTPGLLRVTTIPALPSRVTVDGNIADTWGLNWAKEAPGQHQVCFSDVEGYTTPACQTVTVTAGETTTVTGDFTQRGYLDVTTNPPVPGQITMTPSGTTTPVPMDDWGAWTDVPTGSYNVCFGAVSGFDPPACEAVSVTAGSTTDVVGNYTADASAQGQSGLGLLRVTTSPALPSQVTVDGNIADTWGLNWLEIAPGPHNVCFSSVAGYTAPACQTVTVTAGQTTAVAGDFTQRGYLDATTSPAVAATIYLNGQPTDDWGTWTDIPTGTYDLCYGAATGYSMPACQSVSITAGSTTVVTGN